MAQVLCLICRFAVPQYARVANVLTMYLHCRQGVPGAPTRTECSRFTREPGADDDVQVLRNRGRGRLRYLVLEIA